jgi:hypothetical protein
MCTHFVYKLYTQCLLIFFFKKKNKNKKHGEKALYVKKYVQITYL